MPRTVTESATNDTDTDPMVEEIAAKRAAMEQTNFYEVLEVKRGETPEAIKKAYYALAKKYHPDGHPSCGTNALKDQTAEILTKLAEAYDVLSNRSKRFRYDNKLPQIQGVDPELVGTIQTSPDVLAETKYRADEQVALLDSDHDIALKNLGFEGEAGKTGLFRKFIGQTDDASH